MIFIDSKAGSKELIKYSPLNNPSIATLTDLCDGGRSSCDIAFEGYGPGDKKISIGIEYKSITDLIDSIKSGRIGSTQIPQMKEDYDRSWILVYGLYECCPETGNLLVYRRNGWTPNITGYNQPVKYSMVKRSLISYFEAEIGYDSVASKSQAALWIACCYSWYQTLYSKHSTFKVFDRTQGLKRNNLYRKDSELIPADMPGIPRSTKLIMDFVKELPGIDWERSRAIIFRFESIHELVNASISDWMEVEGFGKTLAKSCYDSIRLKHPLVKKVKMDLFTE